MAFLREAEIRARAHRRAGALGIGVSEALNRAARQRLSRYDIFLSQTIRDAEIVLGVYDLLTSAGYSVFCDWIEAPDADRSQVTPANAAFYRRFAPALASRHARLGADVDRYSFIVVDLHHILLAGLPAH